MEDIPKLYTAVAEWISAYMVIAAFGGLAEREERGRKIALSVVGLFLLCALQTFCGMVSNALWLLGMLLCILVMVWMIRTLLEENWIGAVYDTARAFMKAELAAAFEWQIYSFYFSGKPLDTVWFRTAFCAVVYAALFGFSYFLEKRQAKAAVFYGTNIRKEDRNVTWEQLIIVWFVTLAFFIFSNLSYIRVNLPFTSTDAGEIFNIRTLTDIAGVFLLEVLHIQKNETDRQKEMQAIRSILNTQYMQFRESQENIDMINRKYHDLKHQLQVIREEKNEQKRIAYVDEIENGIRKYETENKTGNSVLDTILTSKCNQCLKQNIQITVVADGTLLNHIHVMDLCTIFGNALDNAIEHEVQIPDEEKRMIHVSVSRKKDFTCVVVENYFEGKLKSDHGVILTTKSNRQYHGYGIKSIQYSVRKYGGYTNAAVHDHWFRLEILLPLNAPEAGDG